MSQSLLDQEIEKINNFGVLFLVIIVQLQCHFLDIIEHDGANVSFNLNSFIWMSTGIELSRAVCMMSEVSLDLFLMFSKCSIYHSAVVLLLS